MSSSSETLTERVVEHEQELENELRKWNWGAFLLTFVWALGHRLWWHAAAAVGVSIISVPLGEVVSLGSMVGLSVVFARWGNRWAWGRSESARRPYSGPSDLRRRERRWVMASFAVVALVLLSYAL